MTVTEFAVLEACAPYTVDSPIIRQFLGKVAQRQTAWSGYPLLFFQHQRTPAIIFLVSGWTDIPAHNEWIASEGNQELLQEAQSFLTVVDFHHIDINFDSIPVEVSLLTWSVLQCSPLDDDRRSAESVSDKNTSDNIWDATGRVLDGEMERWYRLKGFKTRTEEADPGRSFNGHHSVTGAQDGSETGRSTVTMIRLPIS